MTIQARSGIPTTFNTPNNLVQAGAHGAGGLGGTDGQDGSALGNSIFLRTGSSLVFYAPDTADLLTLGSQVAFTDDTNFGAGGTNVLVRGKGTVIYNGTSSYQGNVKIDNANFKVNGQIDLASVQVCRNPVVSSLRGTLSGSGSLTGTVSANSGTISPDIGQTLTFGSLSLNPAGGGALGSLVHIEINANGTSQVAVTGAATLAGALEINLDANAQPGQYTILTSSGITGSFDSVTVTGGSSLAGAGAPIYTLSYLPVGAPTYVQFHFIGYPPPPSTVNIPATVNGSSVLNPAVVCCGRPVLLGPLPTPGSGPTVYSVIEQTGNVTCHIGQTSSQTYLKMNGKNGSCTIVGQKNGVTSNPLKVIAP
ncbi:Fibronectin type-III domain-containing protein [Legionella worsleiensis]